MAPLVIINRHVSSYNALACNIKNEPLPITAYGGYNERINRQESRLVTKKECNAFKTFKNHGSYAGL
jgi:hypothetical protein